MNQQTHKYFSNIKLDTPFIKINFIDGETLQSEILNSVHVQFEVLSTNGTTITIERPLTITNGILLSEYVDKMMYNELEVIVNQVVNKYFKDVNSSSQLINIFNSFKIDPPSVLEYMFTDTNVYYSVVIDGRRYTNEQVFIDSIYNTHKIIGTSPVYIRFARDMFKMFIMEVIKSNYKNTNHCYTNDHVINNMDEVMDIIGDVHLMNNVCINKFNLYGDAWGEDYFILEYHAMLNNQTREFPRNRIVKHCFDTKHLFGETTVGELKKSIKANISYLNSICDYSNKDIFRKSE